MGGKPSSNEATIFHKEQWQLQERTTNHSIWRNRIDTHLHIEQHDKFSKDEQEYKLQRQIFNLRVNSPLLVAGTYFQEGEQREYCATNYKSSLFIERIPIRLADIQHIPYPDYVHLYHQTLNGFSLLVQRLGMFFEVEETYVGINERGVVKVWLSKFFAHNYIIGGKISQQQMVKSIVDIIDRNVDPVIGGNIPTVRNYLYRNADVLLFKEAIQQFQGYVNTYCGGVVPSRLECVDQVGGVYAIANRGDVNNQDYQLDSLGYSNQVRNNYPQNEGSNRPNLVSNQNFSNYETTPPQSEQNLQFQPRGTQVPPFNINGTKTLHPSMESRAIVNPHSLQESMQVVRRPRNELQNPHMHFSQTQPNMHYSQNLQQTPQGRMIGTGLHLTETMPPPQQPIPQNTAPFLQNISQPMPQGYPGIPFNNSNSVQSSQIISTEYGQGRPQIQTSLRPPESNNQITFKLLNGQPVGTPQPLQFYPNPSIANFSPGPSVINSNRAMLPNNSHPIIDSRNNIGSVPAIVGQGQGGTGGAAPMKFSGMRPGGLPLNSVPQSIAQSQANIPSQTINNNQKEKSPQKQSMSSNNPPRQMHPNPTKVEPPAVQPELLASFNPTFTKTNFLQNQVRQSQVVPSKSYSFNQKQSNFPYQAASSNNKFSFNPNDGKTSDQFMKKLQEINQGYYQNPNSEFKPQPTYANPYEASYQKDYPSYSPKNAIESNADIPLHSNVKQNNEEFGRNAVSNIVENHDSSPVKYNHGYGSSEPLKFQQNLTLKYSRLQQDEPKYQYKQPPAKYDWRMDPELMADLNRIKK